MNLNPAAVIMLFGGAVLMYAAYKNKDPRDVIREAIGKPAVYSNDWITRDPDISPPDNITPTHPIVSV